MRQTNSNFIIDVAAFLGFVTMTITGVLMRYILPPGSGHYSTIWGLDRHEWGSIHFWISVVFFSLLALHLILHWHWIVTVVTGRPREGSGFRAGLGVVGLVTVIALSLSLLLTPVERELSGKGVSFRSLQHEDNSIRGSMTLKEIEAATGVPSAYIVEALNLPASVSENERVGLLKREHNFELTDIRAVITEYNAGKER
ncbi:MAG: DUF4405 domain-containing protein [Mariprofundaceae bacterium]|nr:DUF4405 domain-containing protein [Mariprofundaceae bacterium]